MVIEQTISTKLLRRAYDVWSHCYDWVAPLEHGPRLEALAMTGLQRGERVADVGCGTGAVAKRMREMVGPEGFVVSLDLSHQMLRAGAGNRVEADTRQLPVADAAFDVVFSAYVLDLLPLADIPAALRELHRALRPGGRIVLLNMTKRDPSRWELMERVYQWLPRFVVAYLLGACRPVYLLGMTRDSGFEQVERRLLRGPMPSEVVTAVRAYHNL